MDEGTAARRSGAGSFNAVQAHRSETNLADAVHSGSRGQFKVKSNQIKANQG